MSYPLDNPRKEDPPVPVGHYYFETLNNGSPPRRDEEGDEAKIALDSEGQTDYTFRPDHQATQVLVGHDLRLSFKGLN